MKLILAFLLFVATVCCHADEMEDLSERFTKMRDAIDRAKLRMAKVGWKIKHNKLGRKKYHPTSCEEIGKHRTVLPQPEEIKVDNVPGTLPGMYKIYKGDYDNRGRLAACYSRPKYGHHSERGETNNDFWPHVMFEPTNCQAVRFAVRSEGDDVIREFPVKVGDETQQVLCEGDEVVIMQRQFYCDNENCDRRKIDFKQTCDHYMKGFGAKQNNSDFFMGLDPLSAMTSQGEWELVVTAEVHETPEDFNSPIQVKTAKYSNFTVSKYPEYRLDYGSYLEEVSDLYDALRFSKGHPFSSWDRIRYDKAGFNCIEQIGNYAAWWYGPNDEDDVTDFLVDLYHQMHECGFVNSPFAWNHRGGFKVDRTARVWGKRQVRSIKMSMKRTDVEQMKRELRIR